MTENLLKKKLLKTPREHDLELPEQKQCWHTKGNEWLRYQPKEMPYSELLFRKKRGKFWVEPRDSPPAPER